MLKDRPIILADREPTHRDVVYANVFKDSGEPMALKMNLFQPEKITGPTPVIVYLYGGAWERGHYSQKENRTVYFRDLVKLTDRGFTIVSPAYRLSHEAVFPATIHDIKGAMRFLKANSAKYFLDPGKIGVFGNSAGGHLSALIATSYDIPELEGEVGGNLSFSSRIEAAVVYYGPTDIIELSDDYSDLVKLTTDFENLHNEYGSPESRLIGLQKIGYEIDYLRQIRDDHNTRSPYWEYVKLAELANPITHVRSDAPPVMICHGSIDPVIPIKQSVRLYDALTTAGVEAYFFANSLGAHGPTLGEDCDKAAMNFLVTRLNKQNKTEG